MKHQHKAIFVTSEYQVYSLYDGTISVDTDLVFFPLNQETNIERTNISPQTNISVNIFLLIGKSKKILIDTGAGENFGLDYQSQFMSNLLTQGISPDDITDIYLTHIHNDHTGGLTLKNDRVFKNAIVHVHEIELNYWMDKKNMDLARTDVLSPNKKSFVNAKKAIEPYLKTDQIKTFNRNSEFPEGFSLLEMFGHTPGHSLFKISDLKTSLIFCADMVHNPELQFKNPELMDGFDIDKNKGLIKRLSFYENISKNEYTIAGTHIPYPGIGKLRKVDSHYTFDSIICNP